MRRILILLLLALPLPAQVSLVFDQNPTMYRTGPGHADQNSADWWVLKAYTSELACRGWKDNPVPCWVIIVVRSNADRSIAIGADNAFAHHYFSPALRDFDVSMSDLPWTEGPISFSGTWTRDPPLPASRNVVEDFPRCNAFGSYHPCCLIPSLSADFVDHPYSGSFDFDLDGGGNPINVSVSFTLSEP